MLTDFIGRGLRTFEELERSIVEANDTYLADRILDQFVRINQTIASTPAEELAQLALKADYIKQISTGDPIPDIDEMEWELIRSLMDDVLRLSQSGSELREQSNSI